MTNDSTRDSAMQTLWAYAQAHPDDPLRDEIYLLCGSVGEANGDALGQQALEAATNLAPRDPAVWRMLSRSYARANRGAEATAAAQVSTGVEAQNAGDTAAAETQLQEALPQLAPAVAAPVASELGEIAVQRQDWTGASARFGHAYRLRERTAEAAPEGAPVNQALQADAQQLVVALERSGRTQEACETLRSAQQEHDVAAPDQATLDRCQRVLRAPLRNRVELAPSLRVTPNATLQRESATRVAPTPAAP